MYVWTKLGGRSNLALDMGSEVGNAQQLDSLTNNKNNNSQTDWQPVPLQTGTPEAPAPALFPVVGLGSWPVRSWSIDGAEGSRTCRRNWSAVQLTHERVPRAGVVVA